jgi:predicted TIM-barrel fold metal-dependent hydrolase
VLPGEDRARLRRLDPGGRHPRRLKAAHDKSRERTDDGFAHAALGTDTTRTIADIIFSGNARRFPDIRWIFSHAGGTMPFLIERFVRNPILVPGSAPLFPEGVLPELRRFYYDTAQTANPAAMSALTQIIPTSQIVFGTDYPYRTAFDHVKGLREAGTFDAAALAMIERTTALSLLPRLRG